jgi:hypothetical protein
MYIGCPDLYTKYNIGHIRKGNQSLMRVGATDLLRRTSTS